MRAESLPTIAGAGRRLDRWLTRHSFDYHKRKSYRRFRDSLAPGLRPLVVFQMGKVGSSSVVATLREHASGYEVFQIHGLTRRWLREVEGQYRHASRAHHRAVLDRHVLESRYLLERLERAPSSERWKVISLVRDPVARNVSSFFQAFPIYFPDDADELSDRAIGRLDTSRLVKMFLEGFGAERHDLPLTWFPTYLQPVFGVDVYAAPFDPRRGYQIYRSDACDLLVLRFEDLDRALQPALRELLGIDVAAASRANVSSEKSYASAYAEFKKAVTFPPDYLDRLYTSDYARHFYSADEIAHFRSLWS
jgi:hypothetical protein